MAKKNYTEEFKVEAVKLAREAKRAGKGVKAVARELGVHPNTLADWMLTDDLEHAGTGKNTEGLTPEQENEQLRKEIRLLKMEREILKNRRGRRPTCWARSSWRATTSAARKERPAAFWRPVPVKKHGPWSAADLALVTPSRAIPFRKV